MAEHDVFRIATGMDVFFCEQASPWQRGSTETSKGSATPYFRKGTELSAYGPGDLESVAQQLNCGPRKTLGGHRPAERTRGLSITP